MSYPDPNGGYPPPRETRDHESQYPPPPGDEEERARAYHQRAPSSGVTLPSISPYDPQYTQPQHAVNGPPHGMNGYNPDPRAQYPPPYQGQPGPNGPYRDDRNGYQDYGRGAPQHMAFSQSAPRQRTAIACRYCRRRKIRCSGFDQNPEGRCSNCQRFQQECIFTPVSSQATAFVPAHAVYPNMRNAAFGPDGRPRPVPGYSGTQLYGAHGQPLGPIPHQAGSPYSPQTGSPYSPQAAGPFPPYTQVVPQSQPPPTASPYGNEYAQPSPTSSYNSYTDDRERQPQHSNGERSRKRPQQEPHPSILPPPMPGQAPYSRSEASGSRRPAAEDDPRLPPITPTTQATSNYSPGASSTSSNSNLQPPHGQSGHASTSRTPPPRTSPGASSRGDPMSLGSIMDDNKIDKGMLNRLGRKG